MRRAPAALVLVVLMAGCAARTPPILPAALAHPDFVYPAVPATLAAAPDVERIDSGWRYLQNDRLREAEQEFGTAARRSPALYPAQAGSGYVALARGDSARAVGQFDLALSADQRYAPALVGRGQALAALGRDAEAQASFEAALAVDSSLADVSRRVEVIRLRRVQEAIGAGRSAAAAGRLQDARAAFERALTISPDSALLYRELGAVERRTGDTAAALDHFRRAAALDPTDAAALVQVGELLDMQMDFAGAEAAFRAANDIDASPELSARIASVAARGREARLPRPFGEIPALAQITRGDLAALVGIRLEDIVRGMPGPEDVLTDVRGHWAAVWINEAARTGVVAAFENHTFQPAAPVRRVDLAATVNRIVNYLATTHPSLRARIQQRPEIADVPAGHLSYPQVATAVASGVLELQPGNRFDITGAVSGGDAVRVIDRLRALSLAR